MRLNGTPDENDSYEACIDAMFTEGDLYPAVTWGDSTPSSMFAAFSQTKLTVVNQAPIEIEFQLHITVNLHVETGVVMSLLQSMRFSFFFAKCLLYQGK